MTDERHLGEDAELYAAGQLDDAQRVAVEAHVAGCAQCLHRVGEAEETILALERGTRAVAIPSRGANVLPFARRGISGWWIAPAAAAALILGLAIGHAQPQSGSATLAMVNSHFAHSQFSGLGAPAAKAIYARDRAWYYLIVAGQHRYDAYGIQNGRATFLGTTQLRAATSELFVQTHTSFDRIELRAGGSVIEAATIR